MRTCWASSSWVHTETLWTNLIHLKCSSVHMRPLLHCRYLSFTDVKSWDWFDIFQSRGWDFSSLGVPQYLNMRSPTASATPALILHLIPLFFLSSSVHSSWFLSVQLLPIHCCHGSVSRDGGGGEGNRTAVGLPAEPTSQGALADDKNKYSTMVLYIQMNRGQAGLQEGVRKLSDSPHDVWQLCKPKYIKQSLSAKGKGGWWSIPQASLLCYELPHIISTSFTLQPVLPSVWKTPLGYQTESHFLSTDSQDRIAERKVFTLTCSH